MSASSRNCKVVIDYPCLWVYKVIGADGQRLRAAIDAVVAGRECLVTPSRSSSSGKYQCLNLELVISSDEERYRYHAALKGHPDVIIVM